MYSTNGDYLNKSNLRENFNKNLDILNYALNEHFDNYDDNIHNVNDLVNCETSKGKNNFDKSIIYNFISLLSSNNLKRETIKLFIDNFPNNLKINNLNKRNDFFNLTQEKKDFIINQYNLISNDFNNNN